MNKNIAIVIIAVILLGMGLVTYNEYNTPASPPFRQGPASDMNTAMSAENSTEMDAESSTNPQEATLASNTANSTAIATTPPVPASTPVSQQEPKAAPAASPASALGAPLQKPVEKPVPPTTATAPTAPATPTTAPAKAVEKPAAEPVKKAPEKVVAEKVEDPIQQALAASRKESTLPPTLVEPNKAEVAKAPAKPAANTAKIIKRISVLKVGDGITVRLDSNQSPEYNAFRLTSPERLVLDLEGAWQLRAPGVPANDLVSNVRIGDHKDGKRIVIDLKRVPSDIRYLKFGETGLDVRLR